jgi:hypothetical protein
MLWSYSFGFRPKILNILSRGIGETNNNLVSDNSTRAIKLCSCGFLGHPDPKIRSINLAEEKGAFSSVFPP